MKEDVLKDHVWKQKQSVKMIGRTTKERRLGALGYYEAMMLIDNLKDKYRLSVRVPYGEKGPTPMEEKE